MWENKVIGIRGSYRNFDFPDNEDFVLLDYIPNPSEYRLCKAFVQTSICGIIKSGFCNQYKYIKQSGKPYLVVEQPVFRKNMDRNDKDNFYYRLGLWHYDFKYGDFKNKNSPPDRWLQIQKDQDISIKPWKKGGEYILILLQNPIDTSLNSLIEAYSSYPRWLDHIIFNIRKHTDEPIVIRKHPGFVQTDRFNNLDFLIDKYNHISFSCNYDGGNVTNGGTKLYEDFSAARLAIGYNSNSLVEAVCEGIPTISLSNESFAWEVSYHAISEDSIKAQNNFDRTQWLQNCAYTQWKMSEINSGTPYRRLLDET